MVYSAFSDDSSTVSQFTRRKAITITTGGTNVPVSYQAKLIITYEPGMQSDFDDIRFNTKAGGYIDYWIESYTASTTATVWIELPDAITDPGSDIVLMYYGNASLSNGSNIEDTFLFGDDFPGSSIDTGKWDGSTGRASVSAGIMTFAGANDWGKLKSISQFGPDVAIKTKIKMFTGTSHIVQWGLNNPSNLHYSHADIRYDPLNLIYSKDGTTASNVNSNWPIDTWFIGELNVIGGTNVAAYIDGVEATGSPKTTNPSNSSELEITLLGRITDSTTAIQSEWILVRKYIANEPTPSYGKAQHQRRIPQFIG